MSKTDILQHNIQMIQKREFPAVDTHATTVDGTTYLKLHYDTMSGKVGFPERESHTHSEVALLYNPGKEKPYSFEREEGVVTACRNGSLLWPMFGDYEGDRVVRESIDHLNSIAKAPELMRQYERMLEQALR